MKIALKAANGQFVCAEGGGGQGVVANRAAAGPWETFELVVIGEPSPVVPPPAPRQGLWKGCTDFRLFQRFLVGEDLQPILDDRALVGATLVRVLAMKANNTGWDLQPQQVGDYWGQLKRFLTLLAAKGFDCEWTVFADTGTVMNNPAVQQGFWQQTCEVVKAFPHVSVELCNEWDHPTQSFNPGQFQKPAGIWSSHGSGQTDADTVQPRWDYATYHARRDGAKGFTNYNPYEFQTVYPQPCPLIPDEGAKPQDYGFNTHVAELMGRHAALGWGGTFHSDAGVDSRLFTGDEAACAHAFFGGIQ